MFIDNKVIYYYFLFDRGCVTQGSTPGCLQGCPGAQGTFPSCTGNAHFWFCVGPAAVEGHCTGGQIFNPDSQLCQNCP